jgi:hypothetical protein
LHDVRDILLVTNPQFNLGLVTRRVEQLHSYKILDTVISLCFFSGIFPPLLHCCLHRTISFLPQFYTGLAKRCFARWLFQRVDSWLVDVFYGTCEAMICKVSFPKSRFLACRCFIRGSQSDASQDGFSKEWILGLSMFYVGLAKRCFTSPTSVVHASRCGYCVDYRANAWTTGRASHA